MARQVSFEVGSVNVTVVEADGTLTLSYNLDAGVVADFRGFFFNTAVNADALTAVGLNVTKFDSGSGGGVIVGSGADIIGAVANALQPDFGVEIGTQGIAKDDVRFGSFVIASSAGALTLEDLGSQIGIRLTSTGNARNDSLKLIGNIPAAPNARDDEDYVELGDILLLPVLANDTDADGALNPASVTVVSAPLRGTATVNANGTITYDDTIVDLASPSDQSAVDTFNYRVSDTGGNFDEATVTARIVDPLVETQTALGASPNGQSLSLTVRTEDRTANASSFVDVDIQVGEQDRADVNIVFVYDASGSISSGDYAQQILAIQNTINSLRTQFTGAENDVTVKLIRFASDAAESGSFDLFAPALNNISALGITTQTGGSTNYFAALTRANAFIDAVDPTNTEDNYVLFVSDGEPNAGVSFTGAATALKAQASVSAVGFGSGIDVNTLNQLDNTGGAQVVANAAQLGSVFAATPLFDAVLVDFDLTLSVDGGAAIVLADDASDATNNGGGTYTFDLASVTGLSGALSDNNVFTAAAVFDTDGNLGTVADRVTLSTTNIVQGAVPDAFWP